MPLPMIGSLQVLVHAARPFSIHGDLYFEVHASPVENPSEALVLRIPQHALNAPPQPNDKLNVSFLMGQVTSASPVAP